MNATLDAGMHYPSTNSMSGRNLAGAAGRKNQAMMATLAQRTQGSKSVANRQGGPNLNLMAQQDPARASTVY